MTAVKITTAAGKILIQTQWVDCEEDGCMKSRLVLKYCNYDHGRMPNSIGTVSENNVGREFTRPQQFTSQAQLTYIQQSCTRTPTKTCTLKKKPEESELTEDEFWKLLKALYGYREAPRLWHQQVVTKVPDRNRYTSPKFVNVYTDSDWSSQPATCKSTSGGSVQW